ncbi:MAG: hypothetical protein ABII68_12660 [Pseudomonadota bacterium]
MENLYGKTDTHQGRSAFGPGRERLLRVLFVSAFLWAVAVNVGPVAAAAADHTGSVNCDVHSGPCTRELSDTLVALDISPKPVTAMTDLTFRITLEGREPTAAPYIDLGMPGMKMGPNRVSLRPVGNGVYEGTGIIVRCPSGKRIWKATVTLPGAGIAEFVFDVIY